MSKVVVISDAGSSLKVEKDHLLVLRMGKVVRTIPVSSLSEVLCFGRVEMSAATLHKCLRRGVRIALFSGDGRYLGRLSGPQVRNGDLRLAQYKAITDKARSTAFARAVVRAKIRNQRSLLLKRQRDLKDPDVAVALARMRRIEASLDRADGVDELRGLEGAAAAEYFRVFGRLILNPLFTFAGRNRRPPKDPVNAMLSLGYTVVGALLEGDVDASGLDPALGSLHAPAYGRPSLMLDLLEEFRPVTVDSLVLRLVNRRQVVPADFGPPSGADDRDDEEEDEGGEMAPGEVIPALAIKDEQVGGVREDGGRRRNLRGAVYMTGPGRKAFIGALLNRLHERMYYPSMDGVFELRAVMRGQVYRAARSFTDPGAQYEGFQVRW